MPGRCRPRSELIALCNEAVDFERGLIDVRRSGSEGRAGDARRLEVGFRAKLLRTQLERARARQQEGRGSVFGRLAPMTVPCQDAERPRAARAGSGGPSTPPSDGAILMSMSAIDLGSLDSGVPTTTDGRRYPEHLRAYERYDEELLAVVERLGHPRMAEIAAATDVVVRFNVPRWLVSAEWRGLVEREDRDGRPRTYVLTERGRRHGSAAA